MKTHNVNQLRERKRVKDILKNNKVAGILSCTRVIGNQRIKNKLGEKRQLIDPIADCDSNMIQDNKVLIIGGTDGCFSSDKKSNSIRSCI